MKDSIIETCSGYDFFDGTPDAQRHHLEGKFNRDKASEDGLWISLSQKNHTDGERPKPGARCDIHHCNKLACLGRGLAESSWVSNYLAEHLFALTGKSPEEAITEARRAYIKRYGKGRV